MLPWQPWPFSALQAAPGSASHSPRWPCWARSCSGICSCPGHPPGIQAVQNILEKKCFFSLPYLEWLFPTIRSLMRTSKLIGTHMRMLRHVKLVFGNSLPKSPSTRVSDLCPEFVFLTKNFPIVSKSPLLTSSICWKISDRTYSESLMLGILVKKNGVQLV